MRIVDRKTFLAMPVGTVFAKYDPSIIREPMVKRDSTAVRDELVDFRYVSLTDQIDCSGTCEMLGILDYAEIEGRPFALHFNTENRDGLYDADQLFAVWGRDDVEGLISRLQSALAEGYAVTTAPAEHSVDPVSDEDNAPIVVNIKAPSDLAIGDYVFASRWSDCDPGDPWHVGHVSEVGPGYVVVGEVSQRRWGNAMRITEEQGSRIAAEYPVMEDGRALPYKEIARVFGVQAPQVIKR